MSNQGYAKIYRTIQNHWLWHTKEPFDKRSAWIDLILLANWRTHSGMYGGKPITYKRGCVYRSILELSDRWRWDWRKVKRFLMALENDGMVHVSSTTHGTVISLTQYDYYQSDGTSEGTTDAQPKEQPMHTNKKRKELINKDNYGMTRNEDLDAMLIDSIVQRGSGM